MNTKTKKTGGAVRAAENTIDTVQKANAYIDALENTVTRVRLAGSNAGKIVKGYIGKEQYTEFATAYAVLFCNEHGLTGADVPRVSHLFRETLLASGLYHTVDSWRRDFYPCAEIVDSEPDCVNEFGEDVECVKLEDGRYAVM